MSSIDIQSVSAINSLKGNYLDTSVSVIQNRIGYEQGFIFNKIKGLENPVDVTINNYTTQYLTQNIQADQLLVFDKKDIGIRTITTPIIFDTTVTLGGESYLHFDKDEEEELATNATQFFALTTASDFDNRIYFELEILNDTLLRIKHNDGEGDFFLNVDSAGTELFFLKYTSETTVLTPTKSDIFRYILDNDGFLQLYKDISGSVSKIVIFEDNNLTLIPIVSGFDYLDGRTIFKINNNYTALDPFINNSWVSYKDKSPNTHNIDRQKSVFDKPGQYLLHSNYSIQGDTIDLNFVTLNNFRSEKNYTKHSIKTVDGVKGVPDTSLRTYTSLNTGNDQEKGNDNIVLTYVWYDLDIYIKNGSDTYFTAPSSIFPYEKLNINDAGFTSQGAFAGRTPSLSDKLFLLNDTSNVKGNGRYLCTWLSSFDITQEGVWVDRYYYPDIVEKEAALNSDSVYTPSFVTLIDELEFVSPQSIAAAGFYDKRSDVCIIPNKKYIYSRIGEDVVKEIINTSKPLVTGFNNLYNSQNIPRPYSSDTITYDGASYNRYKITKDINTTHDFTISFEMLVDFDKEYGYQIIGNITDNGFGVINDENITPFIYVTQYNKLNVYNSDFVLVQSVVFDKKIIDVVDNKFLEPFFVICEDGYIYKLTAAGVKVKQEIVSDIIGYIAIYQEEASIVFLKDSTGVCYSVDKNTLNPTLLPPTVMLPGLSSQYTQQRGLVKVGDDFFGLPESNIKYVDKETVFFVTSGQYLIKQNLITNTTTPFLSSTSNIMDFNILPDNTIVVLHNDTKITTFDKNRNKISTQDFRTILDGGVLQKIDIVREYTSSGIAEYPIVASVDKNNAINLSRLTSTLDKTVITSLTGTKNNYLYNVPYADKNKYHLTNYNDSRKRPQQKKLTFRIVLTNYLDTEDILSTSIDLTEDDIDTGFHTFTYRFDSLKGIITLFVDGRIFKTVSIPAGKYKIQNIFNDDLFIGTTGFYNGRDLATFLNQPGYYYITGLTIRDLFIFDYPISNTEAYALQLQRKKIDDIVISLPAGQRNNIETINRYFKFGSTASSNSVDIIVKNANIVDETTLNSLRNLVLFEAKRTLPIGVNINKVDFVNYK